MFPGGSRRMWKAFRFQPSVKMRLAVLDLGSPLISQDEKSPLLLLVTELYLDRQNQAMERDGTLLGAPISQENQAA
ncbi:hypothetical protein SKAU_G00149030 [Synaphobranchus kaupii]|uniref:Uncharacterized protein n=1 Tax=Synaphobranchus kaupii TaxID=118154 RepID=A0A9Q1FUS0_SYNKA|nr:hypothetical protein SKAU_G00149030 [Synaphobranchus kaupii]